jgi:hypothetical protein
MQACNLRMGGMIRISFVGWVRMAAEAAQKLHKFTRASARITVCGQIASSEIRTLGLAQAPAKSGFWGTELQFCLRRLRFCPVRFAEPPQTKYNKYEPHSHFG